MNGNCDAKSDVIQKSLFEVITIEEGRPPIYRLCSARTDTVRADGYRINKPSS